VLDTGQIFRVEADGVTRTQITYEVPFQPDVLAVIDFAVSPADGTLIYTVQRAGTPVLVRSGPAGEDAAPFFDDPQITASEPLFTPDGAFVAARLSVPFSPDQTFVNGLYLLPLDGGEPRLLVADDTAPSPEGLAFGHSAARFSPDGARLLTYRIALNVDACDLAVVSVPDGTTLPLQVPPVPPGERVTTCGAAAWSPEGDAIYYVPNRIGAGNINTAIWRANPETGESFPITPQPETGPFTFYAFPDVAEDGTMRAVITLADALPEPFFDQPPPLSYALAQIDIPTGMASELRAELPGTPARVEWDADGAGAAMLLIPASGPPSLWWVPAGAGEPLPLIEGVYDLYEFSWAAS
jgi:dipeptidyl aminopeptidase/acylaminoacyl peptidase